ncbi:NAD(P)-dependent oxidoreductase [Sediminitomix flava]|uniref:D-3-phosphoglycerate dehydrogenase n=1 Tax=Sediminitomix flava TaxID=379075 RepID=A0A316A5C9_SEDFL|nr:NAD(P)-dependent oxidoreductase [Sediminitomix flava]PWJ44967.1 D-3-phosphoglycerate dehydrogenase [Sediminitomix flava]
MIKVLIIDKMHECIVPMLEEVNIHVDYLPELTPEKVHDKIKDYEGLILRSKMKVNIELMDKAPRLRFIARAGAGVDQIDEEYLKRRNISLINAPEGNRDAVGEHALGMLLCLMNKLHIADREIRSMQWNREENRGRELHLCTVGIIGYGNMGREFAKRLKGFGCRVLAFDNEKTGYGDEYAKEVSLDQLREEADVLSFHIPLNQFNRYLVDEEYFKKFRKPFYLINLARGEVIPLQIIKKFIESGKILGAGLDVLENEKLNTLTPEQKEAFDYLIKSDNVLFSPHVGGWTVESYIRISEVLGKKIRSLFIN